MGFSQALSGLNAAATNLDVIGNNIANSQTVGFKGSRTQFADVFASSQVGLGTRVAAIIQDFSTGTLESTGRGMDLAIDGDGFFRMVQNDQVIYSRNGQLTVNAEGYIVNAQGAKLTGYPAGVLSGGSLEELRVPSAALQANPTTSVEATLNLDGRVDAITAGFDPTDPDTYNYANNITLYDSQGNSHNATLYFTKTGDNTWDMHMAVPDQAGDLQVSATYPMTFNSNGINTTPLPANFSFTVSGAVDPIAFELDLGLTTQFGDDFDLSAATQDGYASGALVGIAIDKQGRVIGNYSNEQSQELGTIALARFTNMEGLKPAGDNAWVETTESGQPLLGAPGTGQYGRIEAGTVETSNVELTQQLVDLIIAQRTYQANSQTVKVQDEVLMTAVNMR